MLHNIKLVLAYDGTAYKGFQRQTKWDNTIQHVVERTLTQIFDTDINIIGAGRTDAGVHASGQVVNFKVDLKIPQDRLANIINKHLPADIRVLGVERVESGFHARKYAKAREYKYYMYTGKVNFPGIDRFCVNIDNHFDLTKAKDVTSTLIGTHDFASFMSAGSVTGSTVKTVTECIVQKVENVGKLQQKLQNTVYEFVIEADSFLYNMVRIIVGNMVRVASGALSLEQFKQIVEKRDRKLAGEMMPAQGLYLTKVTY